MAHTKNRNFYIFYANGLLRNELRSKLCAYLCKSHTCLMFSSVTTLRFVGLVEVNVGRCEQGWNKVCKRLADLKVGQCEKLVWD